MILLNFIVEKVIDETGQSYFLLVNDNYKIIEEVSLFLNYLETKRMSLNTIENYCRKLKVFYEWLSTEKIKFNQTTPRNIVSFINYLDKESNRDTPLSPNTINNYISAITSFYNYLSNTRNNISNPFNNKSRNYHLQHSLQKYSGNKTNQSGFFRRKTKNTDQTKRLFQTEIQTLYKVMQTLKKDERLNIRNALIFKVLYETGMRIGECLGLRLNNFSSPNPLEDIGVIYIEKPEVVYHKDHSFKTLSRNVPVSMELIYELEDYITLYRPDNGVNDTIFVNHRGKNAGNFMKRNNLNSLFSDLSMATEIHCTPHKLRHTHGTELAETGYPQEYIQNRLGHSSIESTNQYLHISLDAQIEAYEAFINYRERK